MKTAKRLLATFVSLAMVLQLSVPLPEALAQDFGSGASAVVYAVDASNQENAVESGHTVGSNAVAGSKDEGATGSSSNDADGDVLETPEGDAATAGSEATDDKGSDFALGNESTEDDDSSAKEASGQDSAEESIISVQADADYKITSASDLQTMLGAGDMAAAATVTIVGDKVTAINATNLSKTLIALSNTDPWIYENADISLGASGSGVDLTASEVIGQGTSSFTGSFLGLGSKEHPFAGTMTKQNIKLKHTLFNGLNIAASSVEYELTWQADNGTTVPMLAANVKSEGGSIKVKTTLRANSGTSSYESATESSLVGVVDGNLNLDVEYAVGSSPTTIAISQEGNAGMLVNMVESGTLTLSGFDDGGKLTKVDVKSTNGSANTGYLVGQVSGGAGLKIATAITAPAGSISSPTSGQSGNPGTGGVVGKAEDATVTIGAAVDVSKLSVDGYSAGGFSGRAQRIALSFENNGSIAPAKTVGSVGDNGATTAGGLFGEVIFKGDAMQLNSDNIKLDEAEGNTVKANTYVGGLIGILGFESTGITGDKVIQVDGLVVKTTQSMKTWAGGGAGSGGIVGSLSWPGCAGKLKVSNAKIEYSAEQGTHLGGVAGHIWGPALLDIDNVSIGAQLPAGGAISGEFGGAVGTAQSNIDAHVIAKDFTLSTSGDNPIAKGGGVMGAATKKTVIELKGTTDCSGAKYDSSSNVGQIAKSQDNALIFADGSGNADDANWAFRRGVSKDGTAAAEVDDIGNYGQVIRLGGNLSADFITLNEETSALSVNGGTKLSVANGAVALGSEIDFALLAIDWQTQHTFALTNAGSFNDLTSANITLKADIDLAGTGITGISRDVTSDSSYSGTFNGGGHQIKLAIGEAYGVLTQGADDGDGKAYRHDGLGLFAKAHGSVVDLTIDGSIRFKAMVGTDVAAGGYAAACDGATSVSGVDFRQSIVFQKDGSGSAVNLNTFVGGAFGYFRNAAAESSESVSFGESSKVEPTIKAEGNVNNRSYTGGVVGYVYDDALLDVAVDGLTVSARIEASTSSDSLPVGGFIGFIDQSVSANSKIKTIQIESMALDGLSLNAKSNNVVGGLLGYSWAQTEVSFASGDAETYALNASGAKLDANSAKSVGGLVYHAGGKWTVGEKAISLKGATFSNIASGADGRFGLLVCRGGKGNELGINGNRTVSSLYLENTAEWNDAYKVDDITFSEVNASIFDEWVADTCEVGQSDVFKSDANGVVSLHTTGSEMNSLNMSGSVGSRNSYVNRSSYGVEHKTNQYSRYYYNLDKVNAELSDGACEQLVDTPAELLLWSVYNYADATIRGSYFAKGRSYTDKIKGSFDLDGYSYYPIDLYNRNISISDSTSVTFRNAQIESSEEGNKLTSAGTQHKGMHCALFRDAKIMSTAANVGYAIDVSDLSFAGTIGMLDGGSGALLCGTASGAITGTGANVYTIGIKGCTLNGIRVTGYNGTIAGYAPVLLNKTSTATALSVSGVRYNPGLYTDQNNLIVVSASSLIGDVGGEAATRVSVSFSDVKLPSKTDKIFARATLLNSFSYSESGSGVYNFTHSERDAGNVTFGLELDNSGENESSRKAEYYGRQLYYYNAEQIDSERTTDGDGDSAVVARENNFKNYLPYVWDARDEQNNKHELAVNHEIVGIVDGCGTYGHPYEITTSKQLQQVANIINGTEQSNDVMVRVTTNQNELCTALIGGNGAGDHDVVVTKSSDGWKSNDGATTLNDDTVHRYFQSAYYRISGNIEMTDFEGIGTSTDNAFRGVIVGAEGASLTLKFDTKSSMGLIKYSYGSVVKNLLIKYGGKSFAVAATDGKRINGNVPQVFFGGVIGCVLGGDNIVDGATVSGENGFSVSSNDKLIPIGGYIGVISGGGVIFRNTVTDSWHSRSSSSEYDNPFLGRMLDGYAFSEGCEPNNGDKDSNYKINQITPAESSDITTTLSQNYLYSVMTGGEAEYLANVGINSKQGLLILAGIINSGGASGASDNTGAEDTDVKVRGSVSYLGGTDITSYGTYRFGNARYGKVRNANYQYVGNPAAAASDFADAKKDDMQAPGLSGISMPTNKKFLSSIDSDSTNTPYLVSKYANKATAFICTTNKGANVKVFSTFRLAANQALDMTDFGSGYLGLSTRYVSNAALDMNGKKHAFAVNPHVLAIDGQGATLEVYKNERQYLQDDYTALGAGGLFYTANFNVPEKKPLTSQEPLIKDLTVSDSTISYSFYDGKTNSETIPGATGVNGSSNRLRSIMGVGGVAGVFSPYSSASYAGGVISNFKAQTVTINSPVSGGSVFGMAGYAGFDSADNDSFFACAAGDHANMKLIVQNSAYSGISVTAGEWAGGFFGFLCSPKSGSGIASTGTDELVMGSDSTIIGTKDEVNIDWGPAWNNTSIAGGFAGQVKGSFDVCKDSGSVKFSNVSVYSQSTQDASGSGVVLGYLENAANQPVIRNVTVSSNTAGKTCGVDEGKNSGGIIGRIGGTSSAKIIFDSCNVEGLCLKASNCAGGLLGSVGTEDKTNNSISIRNATVDGVTFDAIRSGGLIGISAKSSAAVDVSDTVVSQNIFNKEYAGALAGKTASKQSWNNIRLDSNNYVLKESQGVMVGDVDASCPGIYAAGIDIRLADGQANESLPSCNFRSDDTDIINSTLEKSYVAYANYQSLDWNADDNGKGLKGATAKSPNAITVPVSSASINGEYLYSDGMNPKLADPSIAGSIYNDNDKAGNGQTVSKKFRYTDVAASDSRQIASSNMSTIAAENNKSGTAANLDVLLVASGQDGVIDEYLDTITNRGYSKAKALGKVTAESATYSFDYETGVLTVPVSEPDATGPTAASVAKSVDVRGSGSGLSFAVTSGYDNTLNRITLLTVKFQTAESGQLYTVYVPVVVRRMVQVDFTATMVNDTDFNKADYAGLGANAHVLAAYGDTVTALLTYTYNSELGDYKEYDWNGHLSAGGNMGPVDKTLKFGSATGTDGNYPPGTQLTLVDCANNNKMYYYEVPTGTATNPGRSVDSVTLSSFRDKDDNAYEPAWMSDTMGVSAVKDTSGNWIECEKGQATASGKLEGVTKYFRVVDSANDTDSSKYCKLTVDSTNNTPSEEFYLVIRFPVSKGGEASQRGLNGYLDSTVNLTVPSRMNNKLRSANNGNWRDSQSNTASTYNILSGYEQSLEDNDDKGGSTVTTLNQNTSDYSFGDHKINVSDTITFAENQISNDADKLYFQLDASLLLARYANETETVSGASGFPEGTWGDATFYVRDAENVYYTWSKGDDGKWSWVSAGSVKTPALSYRWKSTGGEMKLTLGTSSKEADAVSLHNLRSGRSSITIDVEMDVHMSDAAHTAGIAASASKPGERPSEYTKLQYRGVLATNSGRFSSSSSVVSRLGNHGFYRDGNGSSTIEFAADVPSQLGINIDDLSQADGTIAATGTYDLGSLNGSADVIANATEITYTLTLQKRDGMENGNGVYKDVPIGDYLSVTNAGVNGALGERSGAGKDSFVWTDDKGASGFNTLASGSRSFVLPLTIKVDTAKDVHTYANYRLVLTATLTSGGRSYWPENVSDYITYTLTRVNLKGITGKIDSGN